MSEILERCWHEDGGRRAVEAAFHKVYCCEGLVHSEFELVGTDGPAWWSGRADLSWAFHIQET